jgi:pilus assembly protein Flp/PilA
MKTRSQGLWKDFCRREDGLAMTEYLILLGLLTGGTIAVLVVIGADLSGYWDTWAVWFSDTDLGGPTI